MSFLELLLINSVTTFVYNFPALWVMHQIVRERVSMKRLLILTGSLAITTSVLGSLLTNVQTQTVLPINAVFFLLLELTVTVLIFKLFFKERTWQLFGIYCASVTFLSVLEMVTSLFRFTIIAHLENVPAHLIVTLTYGLLAMLLSYYVVKYHFVFLKRLGQLFKTKRVVLMGISGLVIHSMGPYFLSVYGVEWLNLETGNSRIVFNVFMLLFYVLFIMLAVTVVNTDYQKAQVVARQTRIIQQEIHVKRLEAIQQDMRLLQHDYQNILASAQLANSEDLVLTETHLLKRLQQTDGVIAKDLQQVTHLSKVELLEIRSLIAVKLAEMEKRGIICQLDVTTQIKRCDMHMTDLVRCLGILLDNAMEAVETQLDAVVTLELAQHHALVITIQNQIVRQVPEEKMWQAGFSTKGDSRGLGLTSYQKIIDKYRNATKETKIENNRFVQILTIA